MNLTMAQKLDQTRGILNPTLGEKTFSLTRIEPNTSDIASFIQFYWVVRWDLRDRAPYISETLAYPSVNIVIEMRRSGIYGVVSKKFSRKLHGRGCAFGVKFRPGMFFPLLKSSVSSLTDRVVSLDTVFGKAGIDLQRTILADHDERNCVKAAEAFFMGRFHAVTPLNREIRDAVERIAQDRTIVRVEQISSLMGVGIRSLQRTFAKYVGVSPKWVIRRFRLQEAAEALIRVERKDLLALALELGYFDQAHFCRDFKTVVGYAPGEYLARARVSA